VLLLTNAGLNASLAAAGVADSDLIAIRARTYRSAVAIGEVVQRFASGDTLANVAKIEGWAIPDDALALRLDGADLHGVAFGGMNLKGTDFSGSNLQGADLSGARLDNIAVRTICNARDYSGVKLPPGAEMSCPMVSAERKDGVAPTLVLERR
jgi:uncharacterized protein YjbI with pentapeptide repeats